MTTVVGAIVVAGGRVALAQGAAQTTFSIPPGPLGGALATFGRQAGVQVGYLSGVAAGKTSPGLSGPATREQALSQILAGTGLTYEFTTASTVTITGRIDAAQPAVADDGSLPLDTITIAGGSDRDAHTGSGFQGTPDWVYETAESVSVIGRDAIVRSPTRNPRDLLDSVPGVWVNRSDIQNPGITVNIRGLDDSNRIGVSVDGARQNFQILGHNSYSRSYVDTAFIRSAEVTKTGATGVGGGTLGGGVNFRSLVADDLIEPGKQWGIEIDGTTGTNEYHFDGSVVGAWRLSEHFALTGGLSYKKVGEYAIGKNGDLGSLAPDTPTFAGAITNGGFLKAEIDPNPDLGIDLSWLRYHGDANEGTLNEQSISYGAYSQGILNDTATAALDWNPADNNFIDLKAKLWVNNLDMDVAFEGNDYFVATDYNYKLTTVGGSLENTSRFGTALGDLALHYGVEAFRDYGENFASNALIDADPDVASGYGGNSGLATRDFASGFANATLEPADWLTLSGGLRYDWYRMSGDTTWYDQYQVTVCTAYLYNDWLGIPTLPEDDICVEFRNDNVYTAYDESVDHSGGALLPNLSVAAQATDWLQPFVAYGHSFRPPTLMESLFAGGHPGSGAATEWAPNSDLIPETARTLEIGANISHDGVFRSDDSLRAKVVYFYRDIEDYIVLGDLQREEITSNRIYTSFLNVPGTTHMQGVEVEASYDARTYYVGGSLTWLDVDWSDVEAADTTGSLDANSYFAPPRLKVALDGGVRLFDERLTLGGKVTLVSGEQERSILVGTDTVSDYTVYDLYGAFKFNDHATLRAALNNVTDLAYTPALGMVTHPAPGRTFTLSLNTKF